MAHKSLCPYTLISFIPLLLFSCSFDQDTQFYPKTQTALFLIQDELTLEKSVVAVEEAGISYNWEQSFPIGQLADMTGQGNQFVDC